jgi:hypothetical protein
MSTICGALPRCSSAFLARNVAIYRVGLIILSQRLYIRSFNKQSSPTPALLIMMSMCVYFSTAALMIWLGASISNGILGNTMYSHYISATQYLTIAKRMDLQLLCLLLEPPTARPCKTKQDYSRYYFRLNLSLLPKVPSNSALGFSFPSSSIALEASELDEVVRLTVAEEIDVVNGVEEAEIPDFVSVVATVVAPLLGLIREN